MCMLYLDYLFATNKTTHDKLTKRPKIQIATYTYGFIIVVYTNTPIPKNDRQPLSSQRRQGDPSGENLRTEIMN